MKMLSEKRLYALLKTPHIAGTPQQLQKLRVRIGELAAINGEAWVRENRQHLLREWEYALQKGYIK
jgi:hypothetical protein